MTGNSYHSIESSTDATLIATLTVAAWQESVDSRSIGQFFSAADVESLFDEGAVALIARDSSGEPVGSIIVVPGVAAGSVELTKLAVPNPSDRRQGIGSGLIDAAFALAEQRAENPAEKRECHEVVLAVSLYQPQLCRYYARRGFVVDASRAYGHAAPGSPKPIVMVRALTNVESHDPIGDAARALAAGHLVVLPTETVYGLGALASDPVAVRRVFATKGRPVDHPLIVHVANRDAMYHWAMDIPESAWRLAEQLWPGPLTLVLRKAPWVPVEVTGGLETIAIRVPRHPDILAVLGLLPLNSGIAAPSANRFGRVSPTTADDARNDMAAYLVHGDLVVDGGPCAVGVESTILDLTSAVPTILRPGGCPASVIEAILGSPVERVASGPARAPGMLAAHYAPMAGVLVVSPADVAARIGELLASGQRVGYLGPDSLLPRELLRDSDAGAMSDGIARAGVVRLSAPDPYTGDALAPILYARLRDADRWQLAVLVVVAPPDAGLGHAVNDRLRRAQQGSGR